MFLQGPSLAVRPPTLPWLRLFLRSIEAPWNTRWRYWPELCPACTNSVAFYLEVAPRPHWVATCSLCLACGRVTTAYSQPWRNFGNFRLPEATGHQLARPCNGCVTASFARSRAWIQSSDIYRRCDVLQPTPYTGQGSCIPQFETKLQEVDVLAWMRRSWRPMDSAVLGTLYLSVQNGLCTDAKRAAG